MVEMTRTMSKDITHIIHTKIWLEEVAGATVKFYTSQENYDKLKKWRDDQTVVQAGDKFVIESISAVITGDLFHIELKIWKFTPSPTTPKKDDGQSTDPAEQERVLQSLLFF